MIQYLSNGDPYASNGYDEPDPWQRAAQIGAAYNAQRNPAMGGPGGADYDPVFTGHATDKTQLDPRINSMMPTLVQRFGDGEAPIEERSAGLMKYLQQFGADALQRSAAHTRVFGVDPLTLQDRAAKQMEVAMRLSGLKDQQRKSYMDEVKFLGESMGGRPEDIHQSYNRDPAHPNQFFIPAHAGMSEAGEPAREIPGEWRGADPAHVDRLRQLFQTAGWGSIQMPTPDEARAEIARRTRPGMGDRQLMDSTPQPRPLWPWEQREVERQQRVFGWQDWGASPYSY